MYRSQKSRGDLYVRIEVEWPESVADAMSVSSEAAAAEQAGKEKAGTELTPDIRREDDLHKLESGELFKKWTALAGKRLGSRKKKAKEEL